MIAIIVSAILGMLLGGGVTSFFLTRHLSVKRANALTIEQQEAEKFSLLLQIEESQKILYDNQKKIETQGFRIDFLEDYAFVLKQECSDAENNLNQLTIKRDSIQENITIMERQAEQSAQAFYDYCMRLAQERLDKSLEEIGTKFQNDEQAYREEYVKTIKEYAERFQQATAEQQLKYKEAQTQLNELKNAVDVAIAAAKREEEKRQEKNFYRLNLPETDLNEIQKLRAVEPYLKDKEALNKVIWKVYYEKPYTDLIGRVVGAKIKTGIYKITNIENQMCYVGQAANIAERWKQHIKRGLGAEAPTRNKLYPAMQTVGVENFTFEIVEECTREKLDQQEDYWQEFFHAKDFGYSIK